MPRRLKLTLALCCAAQFMVILDISIINVALNAIRVDLRIPQAELQWVVSAYTLAFAGFLLLGGRATDLIGRREVFAGGLAVFGVASLACGLAPTQATLLAARAAQGLGAAIIAPASLAVLTTTFTDGPQRNRALGLWGAMGGAGGTVGSLLSGGFTELLSWRWLFLINVPVVAVSLLGVLTLLARRRAERSRLTLADSDAAGAVTITVGLTALTYGVVAGEAYGFGATRTQVALLAAIVLLGAFGLIEARLARAPLVPLRIFRNRALSTANVVVLLMGASAFSMWYFVALFLQQVRDFSPLEAGLAYVPMTLATFTTAQIAGRATARVGTGPLLTAGMTTLGVAMLLLSRMPTTGTWVGDVMAPSVLAAIGVGLAFVPATIAATGDVADGDAGLASGLLNSSRQLGGSLGLAALATIATARMRDAGPSFTPDVLAAGYSTAFAVGGCLALLGGLVAGVLLLRPPRLTRRREAPELSAP